MRIKVMLACAVLVTLVIFVPVLFRTPSNDRPWNSDCMYAATTSVDTAGVAHISELRDFTYNGKDKLASEKWIPDATIDPRNIVRTWFLVEPFSAFQAVGHTYLTFEMKDGSAYSFSIEARLTHGQEYSLHGGLMRQYELVYVWGTERDFLTRRLIYFGNIVRMYPLTLDAASSQALFKNLLDESNALAAHPRFYNTLTANCTNLLAQMANKTKPGAVPYDISWNLPGWSDYFMMKIGYITTDGTREKTREEHDLTPYRDRLQKVATSSPDAFGRGVRDIIAH